MDNKTKSSIAIALVVVIVVVSGIVIASTVGSRRSGTLAMNVTKIDLVDGFTSLQLGVNVGMGQRAAGYPWRNDTSFVFFAFEKVKAYSPVTFTIRRQDNHQLQCILSFTAQDLADQGLMAITKQHRVSKNCAVDMRVDFTQLDVLTFISLIQTQN